MSGAAESSGLAEDIGFVGTVGAGAVWTFGLVGIAGGTKGGGAKAVAAPP
ncbi:hypothetical protein [Streptomyces wuyuanensis]